MFQLLLARKFIVMLFCFSSLSPSDLYDSFLKFANLYTDFTSNKVSVLCMHAQVMSDSL